MSFLSLFITYINLFKVKSNYFKVLFSDAFTKENGFL